MAAKRMCSCRLPALLPAAGLEADFAQPADWSAAAAGAGWAEASPAAAEKAVRAAAEQAVGCAVVVAAVGSSWIAWA